jgi:hypothetical protein
VKGKKDLVCKLKKSLYGLKQSPRMWYQNFDTYILGLGFVRSRDDHCVYSKQIGNHFIYVVLYVDDMLLVGNNMDVIKEVKSQLSSKFDMKDIGFRDNRVSKISSGNFSAEQILLSAEILFGRKFSRQI